MRHFVDHGKFATVRDGEKFRVALPRGASREDRGEIIREHGQRPSFRLALAAFALALAPLLAASCGGEDEEQDVAEPTVQEETQTSEEPVESTTASLEGDEPDEPFTLADDQPVPPNFRAAYERGAPLVVQFYKQDELAFYPQGTGVDAIMNDSFSQLRDQYPDIEFFSYEINSPGDAESSAGLEMDQYGTLAAQLGVGFTPYLAMLVPQEEGYAYYEVFEGYATQPLLEQALNGLAQVETPEDEEAEQAPDLVLEQAERAGEGGGLEFITIANEGEEPVDLGGYELAPVAPDTNEPADSRLTVDDGASVEPGSSISIGRAPDVEADGEQVDATFGGDASLELQSGDRLALIDPEGSVVTTLTL